MEISYFLLILMIEDEYIYLSRAMHDVFPFMPMLKKVAFIFDVNIPNPELFFNAFEYNQNTHWFVPIKSYIFTNETHRD